MALTDSLIAGYKLDETTGSATWADVLALKSLTQTGTVTSAAGQISNAASAFSGANYLSSIGAWASSGSFSFSLWFYLTSTAADQCFWSQDAAYLAQLVGGRSVTLNFTIANGATSYAVTPTLNAWHHLAGTFDATTVKMFYDGVYRATSSKAWGITPTTSYVGVKDAGSIPLTGRIDELYFWSKALTDGSPALNAAAGGEILELYNAGNAGTSYPWPAASVAGPSQNSLSMAGGIKWGF